jgi:RNA polymerase sigma-70 factor (ECF subfamily)
MNLRVVASSGSSAGSANTLDDGVLVERAQRGDRIAFGCLYDRYSPVLLGVAVRFFRDGREADDLVHDVFLEAWQNIRQYDSAKGTIRTWLLLRLRSRALDRMGRAESRRTRSMGDDVEFIERPSSQYVDSIDAIAVRRALDGLAPDVRSVLESTYFEGLTAKEIAERLAVPVGTVKSRLARGLSALGLVLRGEGESDE